MSASDPTAHPHASAAEHPSEGAASVGAIVSLILASPPEALARGADNLDAALSLVCVRLGAHETAVIAERLAPVSHLFPRSIARLADAAQRLTHHDAAVNVEALRFAPAAHLAAVAALPKLDAATTAILVFRGNADTLATLTANPGAEFATSSFTTLIELAPGDRRIKENLSLRLDLPETLALRLLPFLNRAQLVRMLVAGATIDMATAAVDLAAERDLYHGSGVDPSRPLDDTVAMLCQDARISELSELLADRLAIPLAASMNFLCGRLDHAAGLLLRAAGNTTAILKPVLDLRQRLECRSSKDRRGAHDAFTRYTMDEARALIVECVEQMRRNGVTLSDFDFVAPMLDQESEAQS